MDSPMGSTTIGAMASAPPWAIGSPYQWARSPQKLLKIHALG
jgi:hypothetical protein